MALKKGIKAEKPALTLNFDKEAADDLEYIAKLIEQDTSATISLALGILKKIAGERKRGHRTYIDIGRGRKEEILISYADELFGDRDVARIRAEREARAMANENQLTKDLKREINKLVEQLKKSSKE